MFCRDALFSSVVVIASPGRMFMHHRSILSLASTNSISTAESVLDYSSTSCFNNFSQCLCFCESSPRNSDPFRIRIAKSYGSYPSNCYSFPKFTEDFCKLLWFLEAWAIFLFLQFPFVFARLHWFLWNMWSDISTFLGLIP